jgi:hypothetical protein
LLFFGLANAAGPSAYGGEVIRLLSDEAADVCIKDAECMRRLFVHASFGGEQSPDDRSRRLFKWSEPVRVASFVSNEVADGVQTAVGEALQQMRRIAAIAGGDFSPVDKNTRQVVNFVLLISDDFAQDRDKAFSTLLADVFTGRSALYDKLASGTRPVCRGQLFAERDASIAGGLALVESDVEASAFGRCLHRVVLNVLGFRHLLPDGVDSVLSPNSKRQAWTSIDYMLLRMLNDPAVVPGMEEEALAAVFPQVHQRALRPSS